jgi:hypothetical protein
MSRQDVPARTGTPRRQAADPPHQRLHIAAELEPLYQPIADQTGDSLEVEYGRVGRRLLEHERAVPHALAGEAGSRPGAHDAARLDHRDTLGRLLHLGEDVRGEERRPAGVLMLGEQFDEPLFHHRVQALGRLVEHEHARLVLERLHDADLLPHPARVQADLAAQVGLRQLEPVAQLLPAPRPAALQRAEVVQTLAAAHQRPQPELARQVADLRQNGIEVACDVAPEDADHPGGRPDEAEHAPDGGRLARPVRSDIAERLALADGQ